MGTLIKETSIFIGNGQDSSIDLAARAVNEVIEKNGANKRDINLLINIGTHRDNNIAEPAIASLIQKRSRLNLNPTSKQIALNKGTFSFDVLKGTCGFLTAIQVVDSFFRSGLYQKAIIVSSNVHPSGNKLPEFPFTPSGAAMLLERTGDDRGFKDIVYKTSENGSVGIEQYIDTIGSGKDGRKRIEIEIADDYTQRLKKFVLKTIMEFIDKGVFCLQEINHIITSTPSKEFGRDIADSLGYKKNTLIEVYDYYGDTHTSSPIIGYHIAQENGDIKDGDKLFFISGSSGLSCALGIYEA